MSKDNNKGSKSNQYNPKEDKYNKTRGRKKNFSSQGNRADSRNCSDGDTHLSFEGRNDINWYVGANDQLLRDTASLPFSHALGTPISLLPGTQAFPFRVPGILALHWRPIPGYSVDASSPINICADNIYTFVRHQNSGSKNYDAPDLMLYLLSMDAAYTQLFSLIRVYAVANLYSYRNRYFPRTLLQALGVDPESVIDNLANVRARINTSIAKLASLKVPDTMSIFKRHAYLALNIFTDSDDKDKSQTYIPVVDGFYRFVETDGAGYMEWVDRKPTTVRHIDRFFDDLSDALGRIIESEDMNVMSGDILKAYGEERCYKLSYIEDAITAVPTRDEIFLSQIENATCLNATTTINYPDITQEPSTGVLRYDPRWTTQDDMGQAMSLFNMHTANPTPGDVMEASRLHTTFVQVTKEDAKKAQYRIGSAGTELVTDYYVYDLSSPSGLTDASKVLQLNVIVETAPQVDRVPMFTALSTFDWHPICYYWSSADGSAVTGFKGLFADIDNYSVLAEPTKAAMDEVALLHEFGLAGKSLQ